MKTSEQKRIYLFRLISGLALLLCFFIPGVWMILEEVKIVSESVKIIEYNASLNKSTIQVELEFNKKVDGEIIIQFFDIDENKLQTKTAEINGEQKQALTFTVNGEAETYKIDTSDLISKACDVALSIGVAIALLAGFPLFIASFFASTKCYNHQGKEIIVYAGLYYHYLKVDGVKLKQHNAVFHFNPIVFEHTFDSKDKFNATINFANKISSTLNNALYK